MKLKLIVLAGVLLVFAGLCNAAAIESMTQPSAYWSPSSIFTSTTYQPQPTSFQTYYGSEMSAYWPILTDKDTCKGRQDLLLQVAPAGCQPMVVRSDLLAEQNVPVLCQINALDINPLVDVKQIKSIRFSGNYPKEVAGTTFHPAKAALRTTERILGSPLADNVGYVVVVLKKNPKEKELPDFVEVNLTGKVEYSMGNVIGVGRTEFILSEQDDADWERTLKEGEQSFWNGQYSLRLEQADEQRAVVGLYYGGQKASTLDIQLGMSGREVYLPGAYCQVGLQAYYDSFEAEKKRAVIEVTNGDKGTDRFVVYEGSRFLNDECYVSKITSRGGLFGDVDIICSGRRFTLSSIPKAYDYQAGQQVTAKIKDVREVKDYDAKIVSIETSGSTKKYIVSYKSSDGKEEQIATLKFEDISPVVITSAGAAQITDKSYDTETEKAFEDAIKEYQSVAGEFSEESGCAEALGSVAGEKGLSCGEIAYKRMIELADNFEKSKRKYMLISEFLNKYPNSALSAAYKDDAVNLLKTDLSKAGYSIDIYNVYRRINLKRIEASNASAAAKITLQGVERKLQEGESYPLLQNSGRVTIERVEPSSVVVGWSCEKQVSAGISQSGSRMLSVGDSVSICGVVPLKFEGADMKRVARVRLAPIARGTETSMNLSVKIGIEKRAIQLSPAKTEEMIKNLDANIKKWESISQKLGNLVSGLQKTCLATAGFLTLKNFVTGLGGAAAARTEVMSGQGGWTERCRALVSEGKYPTLTMCYNDNAKKIDDDVNAAAGAMNSVNGKVSEIEGRSGVSSEGGFFKESSINTDAAKMELAKEIVSKYGDNNIIIAGSGNVRVRSLLCSDSICPDAIKLKSVSYIDLRNIYFELELQRSSGISSEYKSAVGERISSNAATMSANIASDEQYAKQQASQKAGVPSPFMSRQQQGRILADVIPKEQFSGFDKTNLNSEVSGVSSVQVGTEIYYLGLQKANDGSYSVKEVFDADGNKLSDLQASEIVRKNVGGQIVALQQVSYNTPIKEPQIKFYETEPYKGMPAIVPFDKARGWYAATKQTLPVFGGIGAYDASGRVTSFMLCNAGANGRIEFESNYGDDICQLINVNTGQPLNKFPGLSEQEANAKVRDAIAAIEEASRQYGGGKRVIIIKGERYDVGTAMANVPSMQCEDFMSPTDCRVMFNVCDPVICPSSRCDLGGAYPVPDVIQTGIIGSSVLCLPNIREPILIPVCLTGIQSGLDSYVSILKNTRDCLQTSLNTSQLVGICDQMYSVYKCQLFWDQVAPFAEALIPKLISYAYGQQRARGGGEYATVSAAWTNMQNSVKYMTQVYGVDSMQAFQFRSISQIGSDFCKASVSMSAPAGIKSIVEPASPPQFSAWFDSTKYSDATLPATSQYKVFYHIFAGKSAGVYYSVYLKSPPEYAYYSLNPTIPIASGFIAQGQYASETKDFTAPEGYKELCVSINNKESCGFKQVSTSFAVNYARDSYVSSEITKAGITSEQGCVSGSPTEGAIMANNLNPQSLLTEAAMPEVYNRGIVRICSSQNPGLTTEPTRFAEVGYCGDTKIKCWLDKNSVDKVITINNKGLRNSTLEAIGAMAQAGALANIGMLNANEGNAEIESIKNAINDFGATIMVPKMGAADGVFERKVNTPAADKIIGRIDAIKTSIALPQQKAAAAVLRAKVKEIVANAYIFVYEEKMDFEAQKANADAMKKGEEAAVKKAEATAKAELDAVKTINDYLNSDVTSCKTLDCISYIENLEASARNALEKIADNIKRNELKNKIEKKKAEVDARKAVINKNLIIFDISQDYKNYSGLQSLPISLENKPTQFFIKSRNIYFSIDNKDYLIGEVSKYKTNLSGEVIGASIKLYDISSALIGDKWQRVFNGATIKGKEIFANSVRPAPSSLISDNSKDLLLKLVQAAGMAANYKELRSNGKGSLFVIDSSKNEFLLSYTMNGTAQAIKIGEINSLGIIIVQNGMKERIGSGWYEILNRAGVYNDIVYPRSSFVLPTSDEFNLINTKVSVGNLIYDKGHDTTFKYLGNGKWENKVTQAVALTQELFNGMSSLSEYGFTYYYKPEDLAQNKKFMTPKEFIDFISAVK